MDQAIGSRCEGCGRLIAEGIPEWAQSGPRRGIFGRQGLIFMTQNKWLFIVLSVITVAAVVWHNYHVIPNPVTLLQTRPSTNLSSLSEPGQWSMASANFERTSYVPNPPSLPQGNLLWSTEEGLIEGQSVPAVVDSTVYVGSRFKFMALDANTGQTKWLRDMPGLVNSSPAVAGDNVYVGSTDTKVWVFDKDTGDEKWTFKTENYISSSPMVANGYLFIGSGDFNLYALDAATGEKLWVFETGNLITAPPALHKGVLYFTSQDNSLYSVNYRTGEGRMQFRTRGVASFAPPVIAHGLAYMASSNDILTAKAGIREIPGRWQREKIWRTLWLRWGAPIPRPPAQQGTNWRWDPPDRAFVTAAPAITEDALYTGDSEGRFRSMEPTEPAEMWTFQAEGAIRGSPIVAGDMVYFATLAGKVYALNRHTGQEIWNLSLGSPVMLSPALAEGKLFVRTEDGRIHAIG
jgi:serine/threonine-protein kinase